MKKFILFFTTLFVSAALFAQTTSKELLAGVYDFATKDSSTWKIYDSNFSTIDPIGEEYIFTGAFVVKILVGSARYDFTCRITNGEDDFVVELSDMTSCACDKKGNKLKDARSLATAPKVAEQYAEQIKAEIKKRIDTFNKKEIFEQEYTKIVTNPAFLKVTNKSISDLALKKFLEENVNGKEVTLTVT